MEGLKREEGRKGKRREREGEEGEGGEEWGKREVHSLNIMILAPSTKGPV